MGTTIGNGQFNNAATKQPQEERKSSAKRKQDLENVQDYTDREYKRYHFLPNVNDTIPEEIKQQSEKERREEDLSLYSHYRDDKTVVQTKDGGLGYFVISAEWIKLWRDFVNKKGGMPGPVENKPIADYI